MIRDTENRKERRDRSSPHGPVACTPSSSTVQSSSRSLHNRHDSHNRYTCHKYKSHPPHNEQRKDRDRATRLHRATNHDVTTSSLQVHGDVKPKEQSPRYCQTAKYENTRSFRHDTTRSSSRDDRASRTTFAFQTRDTPRVNTAAHYQQHDPCVCMCRLPDHCSYRLLDEDNLYTWLYPSHHQHDTTTSMQHIPTGATKHDHANMDINMVTTSRYMHDSGNTATTDCNHGEFMAAPSFEDTLSSCTSSIVMGNASHTHDNTALRPWKKHHHLVDSQHDDLNFSSSHCHPDDDDHMHSDQHYHHGATVHSENTSLPFHMPDKIDVQASAPSTSISICTTTTPAAGALIPNTTSHHCTNMTDQQQYGVIDSTACMTTTTTTHTVYYDEFFTRIEPCVMEYDPDHPQINALTFYQEQSCMTPPDHLSLHAKHANNNASSHQNYGQWSPQSRQSSTVSSFVTTASSLGDVSLIGGTSSINDASVSSSLLPSWSTHPLQECCSWMVVRYDHMALIPEYLRPYRHVKPKHLTHLHHLCWLYWHYQWYRCQCMRSRTIHVRDDYERKKQEAHESHQCFFDQHIQQCTDYLMRVEQQRMHIEYELARLAVVTFSATRIPNDTVNLGHDKRHHHPAPSPSLQQQAHHYPFDEHNPLLVDKSAVSGNGSDNRSNSRSTVIAAAISHQTKSPHDQQSNDHSPQKLPSHHYSYRYTVQDAIQNVTWLSQVSPCLMRYFPHWFCWNRVQIFHLIKEKRQSLTCTMKMTTPFVHHHLQ